MAVATRKIKAAAANSSALNRIKCSTTGARATSGSAVEERANDDKGYLKLEGVQVCMYGGSSIDGASTTTCTTSVHGFKMSRVRTSAYAYGHTQLEEARVFVVCADPPRRARSSSLITLNANSCKTKAPSAAFNWVGTREGVRSDRRS